MNDDKFGYFLTYDEEHRDGLWCIYVGDFHDAIGNGENIVFRCYGETQDNGNPPAELCAEYERLIGYKGEQQPEPFNIVEQILADPEECAFDQPCAWGHNVKGHSVYCHNTAWLYAPRKCRRGWDGTHTSCAGYRKNDSV